MKPEVVVITGASAGVGRAAAQAFGKRGALVGLLARGRDGLEGARREIESAGGRALVLPTDVADAKQVEAAAQAVENKFGPIDVWVNNAGRGISRMVSELTDDDLRHDVPVAGAGDFQVLVRHAEVL